MPLYTRNKPESYGSAQSLRTFKGPALEHLLKHDPVTPYFEMPKDLSPRGLLRYVQIIQNEKFGRTFLSQGVTEGAMIGGLRRLINSYGAEIVARAIALGAEWANHPFAHGYIKKWCERAKTECSSTLKKESTLTKSKTG